MKWEYIVAAFLIGMAVCQSNWYIAHGLLILGLVLVLYRVMVVEPPYWEEESDVDTKQYRCPDIRWHALQLDF